MRQGRRSERRNNTDSISDTAMLVLRLGEDAEPNPEGAQPASPGWVPQPNLGGLDRQLAVVVVKESIPLKTTIATSTTKGSRIPAVLR